MSDLEIVMAEMWATVAEMRRTRENALEVARAIKDENSEQYLREGESSQREESEKDRERREALGQQTSFRR